MTLHQAVQPTTSTIANKDWIKILFDTVSAVSVLHKDIKGNNIVEQKNSSNVYSAVLTDFGKARRVKKPKKYNLNKVDQVKYTAKYEYIVQELIQKRQFFFRSDF